LVPVVSSDGPVTAVRALDVPTIDDCSILTPTTSSYRDGAEERVYELIRGAADLSSMSDELAEQATSWAEHYHLTTSRANLIRPFALGKDAVVLEIGAGCGAITRYLGERCGWVDAVEPVLSRARAARARSRDLSNVEVFVGSIEDLPAEPTYDLVVVVGVLEYVGEGAGDLGPQRSFLGQIEALLRPGGSLLLAIENKLGVKYLAGAGEDHTGRVYDSVEGYPAGTIARTFSRSELTVLLESVGLTPSFYCAFPDYKIPRTVLSDAVFESVPPLAWRIPKFPSPNRAGTSSHAINEERLWRALVQDGLGPSFGNSFVVTARKGSQRSEGPDLWPVGQLAAFYQPERRAAYATQTLVCERDSMTVFVRSPLRSAPESSRPVLKGLQDAERVYEQSALVPGTDLLEVLEGADDDRLEAYLREWVAIAEREANERGGYELDLLPHNLIETSDGSLEIIDREWGPSALSREEFLAAAQPMAVRHVRPGGRLPRGDGRPESLGRLADGSSAARSRTRNRGVDRDQVGPQRADPSRVRSPQFRGNARHASELAPARNPGSRTTERCARGESAVGWISQLAPHRAGTRCFETRSATIAPAEVTRGPMR
jgi:SAM-dependent methyltransferase